MSKTTGAFSQFTVSGLVGGDNLSRFVGGPFVPNVINSDMAFRLHDTAVIAEPGALAMFGLGLAGLGVMRRRRKVA
jgi:hypothetical protein